MAKSFDLQVHHYGKEGKVVRSNPYRLKIDSSGKQFERPVGSGMWYAEDGSLLRDESAAVKAKEAEEQAKLAAEAEAKANAEHEAMKAQIRLEVLAEEAAKKKAGQNGSGSKA